MADHQPCDHTQQRRYVYGGTLGDQFHCPCGKIFTAADFRLDGEDSLNPSQMTVLRRYGVLVSDRVARLWLGGSEDSDAGNRLVPA